MSDAAKKALELASEEVNELLDWLDQNGSQRVGGTDDMPLCRVIPEIEQAAERIRAQAAEIGRLQEALAFYADDENWNMNGPLDANSGYFTGGPARAALEDTQ